MQCTYQPAWDHVRDYFQKIWGYDDFRPPQGEIIQCLLAQQDALIVMPTGGGKSICFQLPALMRTGLTLVVSPLVALMENQVQDLIQRQLPAASLHSELPTHRRYHVLRDLERQRLRLLYLSPETLLSQPVWERLCHPHLRLNGLILDEAHCLVQWGDTFRPAYRRLGVVRKALLKAKPIGSRMAIAAFTATADPATQNTIKTVLQLENPQIFLLSPYRSNLQLCVRTAWTPRGRRQQLQQFIKNHPKQSGLVYARTRQDSEDLALCLGKQGHRVTAYHAGLSPNQRRQIETEWLSGDLTFVVCTSAFGMGINKPDVRWVIHFHAPCLLSEYIQEIGRAGRDGQPAEALTLVSERTGWLDPSDQQRHRFFAQRIAIQCRNAQQLTGRLPRQGDVDSVCRQFKDGAIALSILHSMGQLEWHDPFTYTILSATRNSSFQLLEGHRKMQRYLYTQSCRWQFLLDAFGFQQEAIGLSCNRCDWCQTRSRHRRS
jgi:ATP-dependent DNA helicase RecQ